MKAIPMDDTSFPSFRFGSEDSQDIDRVFVVPSMPSLQDSKAFCDRKGENRNLIVIQEGLVTACFKGLPDEMNNALLATYGLHPQDTPCPVTRKLPRIVPLKLLRACRVILSLLSHTAHRPAIKDALQSYDQGRRQEVLAAIDFAPLDLSADVWKSIAFQLGQTQGLIDGQELYTKTALKQAYPVLTPFLSRQASTPTDRAALGAFRDLLLQTTQDVYVRVKGRFNLFCYISSVKVRTWNPYVSQCRGLILDAKAERVACFPYEKFFKLDEIDGWRRGDLPPQAEEIVEKVDGSFVSLYKDEGQIAFACKGSFDAEQAQRAALIADKYNLTVLDLDRYDYTMEVVYPENRFPQGFAMVDYKTEALYLTGVRDRKTYAMLPYADVRKIAKQAGLRCPKAFDVTFDEILAMAKEREWQNVEGWVANFGGKRVKIKTQAYVRISDVCNGLKHGRRRLIKEYVQTPPDLWDERLTAIPDGFLRPLLDELEDFHREVLALEVALRDLLAAHPLEGEAFVAFLQTSVEPLFHRTLFRMKRGLDVRQNLRALTMQHLIDEAHAGSPKPWNFFLPSSP